jgi:hypothetical protein
MTEEENWTWRNLICTILEWTVITMVAIAIIGFYIAFYVILGMVEAQEYKRYNTTE